jgi:DNA-binding transcriptional LysR family regulator
MEKILFEKLILVSRPKHPLVSKTMVEASDLHSQILLVIKTGCGYGLPFRQLLSTHIVQPVSIIEITSVEAIKKCVKNGIGLAVLPECSIQKELENNELVPLKWINDLQTTILMVWHKDKRISPALGDFMNLVRNLRSNSEVLLKKKIIA